MTNQVVKIGNAQGFWGDRTEAAAELLRAQPDLDYLTLDYLAEVSMSILARQRARDGSLGYARDFVAALKHAMPHWTDGESGKQTKIITNAGGLNPRCCAEACRELLRNAGCRGIRIAVISGDDVLPKIRETLDLSDTNACANLDDGRPITEIAQRIATANAYLGAHTLVEALTAGADLMIAGRVADPSMTVAPCIHHFGWDFQDFDKIAGATIAGHLIECGTQVTGGVSTDWLTVPDAANIAFPIVEVDAAGNVVVTKPQSLGGRVTEQTVKEQLLYEIGDPACYLSPDATVSFTALAVEDLGNDRVRVSGAKGSSPPSTYKVSATYAAGYRATGELTIIGTDTRAKAERCGALVHERLCRANAKPENWLVETIAGDLCFGENKDHVPATVLRMSLRDENREVVERFTREVAPLVTAGPQGTTGYAAGRPRMQEVFGFWPCLIDVNRVNPHVDMIEV